MPYDYLLIPPEFWADRLDRLDAVLETKTLDVALSGEVWRYFDRDGMPPTEMVVLALYWAIDETFPPEMFVACQPSRSESGR